MPKSLRWCSARGFHEHELNKQPVDVLAKNLMMDKPAALNFTVTSPLVFNSLPDVSLTARSAAFAAEKCKHRSMMLNALNWDGCPSHLQWRCMVFWVRKLVGHYLSLLPDWVQDRTAQSP